MKTEQINFTDIMNPTAKQKVALKAIDDFKYILYGGAAGGGKSYLLRWAGIKLLLQWYGELGSRNIRIGLFCEDYPTLKDRQLSKVEEEFPAWLGKYNKTDKEFKLHAYYGGGVICFRNLDDPSKYASSEFAAIIIDELTKNKKKVFDFLRLRLRYPGIEEPKFIAGSNPDGIGHLWVKRIWLDHKFEEGEIESNKFAFIPAKPLDNPYLPKSYILQLDGLPENLRKAYRDGNWDVFDGQFFSEWDKEIHSIDPFAIPATWRRSICMDYGWTAPSAIYWRATDSDNKKYYYRELYKTKMTPIMIAEQIVNLTPKDEISYIEQLYYDPSMNATKAGEQTIISIIEEYFAEHNFHVKCVPAMNDRVSRATLMRQALQTYIDYNGKKTSKIQIFKNCTEALRTIPALIFDKRNPEDVDTKGEDHAYDAITYDILTDVGEKADIKKVLEQNQNRRELISAGDNW